VGKEKPRAVIIEKKESFTPCKQTGKKKNEKKKKKKTRPKWEKEGGRPSHNRPIKLSRRAASASTSLPALKKKREKGKGGPWFTSRLEGEGRGRPLNHAFWDCAWGGKEEKF